jgi:hypothetical protein
MRRHCQYYEWPCCIDGNQCPEPAIASLTNLKADDPNNPLSEKTFWYCAYHYDSLASFQLRDAADPDHPYRQSHEDFCILNGLL